MSERLPTGRFLVGLTALGLLAGCASGATPAPPSATPAPTSAAAVGVVTAAPTPAASPAATVVAAPTPTVTPAPTPTPAVVETTDVAYGAATALLKAGKLDVYVPASAGPWPVARGPWPVVVMFHGEPANISRDYLREYARRVAEFGFVVFVPAWGDGPDGQAAPMSYDTIRAVNAEASCAVAFARSHAAKYGGNPETMIVFGQSAGADRAAMVAFARPTPTPGCLGARRSGRSTPWSSGRGTGSWADRWMPSSPRTRGSSMSRRRGSTSAKTRV